MPHSPESDVKGVGTYESDVKGVTSYETEGVCPGEGGHGRWHTHTHASCTTCGLARRHTSVGLIQTWSQMCACFSLLLSDAGEQGEIGVKGVKGVKGYVKSYEYSGELALKL